MPLLAATGAVLEQHGWSLRPVAWTAPDPVPSDGGWVGEQASAAMAGDPGPWLCAAKSLGTRIVQSEVHADALVLLTPLTADTAHAAAITRRVEAGVPVLLVGGSADPFWSSEASRATGAEVCEVPGADHAMVGAQDQVAAAVEAFLAAPGSPSARGR